ncbi:hypothetical protein JHK85_016083 [Glycine max]|nr:hypothetical protein JHK85_016083 [Glycine max]
MMFTTKEKGGEFHDSLEEQSRQGSIVPSGRDNILNMAIGRPEHPGRPVIAGLGDEDKPFIYTMDCLGAKELAKDFVVSGTASESLYGACEAMFKPDMLRTSGLRFHKGFDPHGQFEAVRETLSDVTKPVKAVQSELCNSNRGLGFRIGIVATTVYVGDKRNFQ